MQSVKSCNLQLKMHDGGNWATTFMESQRASVSSDVNISSGDPTEHEILLYKQHTNMNVGWVIWRPTFLLDIIHHCCNTWSETFQLVFNPQSMRWCSSTQEHWGLWNWNKVFQRPLLVISGHPRDLCVSHWADSWVRSTGSSSSHVHISFTPADSCRIVSCKA